jgi:predicted ATPase
MAAIEDLAPATEALLERADELGVLADALDSVARTGRGRLVLIAGEAGIGKTVLLHAFCSDLTRTRVLSGACEALYAILRRGGWRSAADLAEAAARSTAAGETMPDERPDPEPVAP